MFLAWPIHLGIGCICKSKLMELALTSMKKIRGQGVLQKEKSFLNQCNILFIVKEPADLHVIAGYMTDLQLLYIGTALWLSYTELHQWKISPFADILGGSKEEYTV